MALVKRVALTSPTKRKCAKCGKLIAETEAIKDRTTRYKITPAKKDKDGNVVEKKKIEHIKAAANYYHLQCYRNAK